MSKFLDNIDYKIFGTSHSEAVTIEINGLPKGESIDFGALSAFLSRRAPGQGNGVSERKESDIPSFSSGFDGNVLNGQTVYAEIKNRDINKKDYDALKGILRPSHADYAAYSKYSLSFDMSGGAQFSGRMTAPFCLLGGICIQILEKKGIKIAAHIKSVGNVFDTPFDEVSPLCQIKALKEKKQAVLDDGVYLQMLEKVSEAKQNGDSLGGQIECAVSGLKAGQIGGAMLSSVESVISALCFGIPAVKAVYFGNGDSCAFISGSQNNDEFIIQNGEIKTPTNRHGGILGGISSGMPIIFSVAIKPTPSISKEQNTVDMNKMVPAKIKIPGRHDACIALRCAPIIESVAAICILDMIMGEDKNDA